MLVTLTYSGHRPVLNIFLDRDTTVEIYPAC
jgi:hypothetical protein